MAYECWKAVQKNTLQDKYKMKLLENNQKHIYIYFFKVYF